MATTTKTVTAAWPASPHYTASGETDIAIKNGANLEVRFCTTTDDTQPTLDATLALSVEVSDQACITLNDGERLWMIAPGAPGDVTVAIHY